jgi:hypothetical protein
VEEKEPNQINNDEELLKENNLLNVKNNLLLDMLSEIHTEMNKNNNNVNKSFESN